jgi:hypothetical protein
MGFGFHGINGIDAVTPYKIYHTYVLPRLIYGLEVLPIRYLQSLPQRIATALLVGAIPIEAELRISISRMLQKKLSSLS